MSHPRSRSPSVPSEGEIVESGPETKATASKPPLNGTTVDRPTRASPSSAIRSPASLKGTRSRTRSLSRSRSRSPYRENKTQKRSHDDLPESYDGSYDRRPRYEPPRHYRSRYDDRRRDRRPNSYYDYDREDTHGDALRYSDDYDRHDRHKDKRQRTRSRSRSPYREPRKPKQYSGDELDSNVVNARSSADTRRRLPTEQLVRERGKASVINQDLRLGAEKQKNQVQASSNLQARVTDEYVYSVTDKEERVTNIHPREITPNPEISQEPELAEPINEVDALEARRKRREAIRAKHRSQATPLHLKALNVGEVETDSSTPGTEPTSAKEASGGFLSNNLTLISTKLTHINSIDSPTASPFEKPGEAFPGSIGKDMDIVNSNAPVAGTDMDDPSAADYDPTLDTKQERQKHGNVQGGKDDISSAAYDETKTVKQDILLPDAPAAPPPKTEAFDMFADDDDDMFAEEAPEPKPAHASATAVPQGKELDISMMDNWDDSEGYYAVRLGELINGRYHVHQNLGKGMFSSVVRATDAQTGGLVAVKIIRQNAIMRKAGMKEIGILEQLQEADPQNKMHLIKFDRYFDHKGHLCMVFENLSMDLREVLKKFGRDVGLNLRAVRAYGQQIFLGLSHLRRCNILHADLKPDNLLVNEQRNILKVCDLGSASPASDNEITPYLVSRFYRAPEIILGIPYDYAIDVWSIGCTLFELYTGKILFTGRNNNQMLRSIMECRGKYPPKLLRRGSLSPHHFDEMLNFHSVEEDKITGRLHTKIVDFKKPTRDLKSRLMAQGTRGMPDAEVKELTMFLDLLDRCLSLNPEKRITPAEALKHPFLAPRA